MIQILAESASGASGTQDISLQSDIPIIDPSLPMSSGKMYYASSLNIVHVEELVDSSFTMFKYKLSDGKTIQTSPSMKTDGSGIVRPHLVDPLKIKTPQIRRTQFYVLIVADKY